MVGSHDCSTVAEVGIHKPEIEIGRSIISFPSADEAYEFLHIAYIINTQLLVSQLFAPVPLPIVAAVYAEFVLVDAALVEIGKEGRETFDVLLECRLAENPDSVAGTDGVASNGQVPVLHEIDYRAGSMA